MSKLICGRCGTKVNVVTNNSYVKDEGVIYCDDHCFYNRKVPLDISRDAKKKKIKKKPIAHLYIVENWDEYEQLRTEIGTHNGHIYNMIITLRSLNDSRFFYKHNAEKHSIKQITYKVELNSTQVYICEKLKDRSNGIYR